MQDELARLKAERALWERRVALLRSDQIDPDMLDERARALLGFADPRDLIAADPPALEPTHAGNVIHRRRLNVSPVPCRSRRIAAPAASRFRPRPI